MKVKTGDQPCWECARGQVAIIAGLVETHTFAIAFKLPDEIKALPVTVSDLISIRDACDAALASKADN